MESVNSDKAVESRNIKHHDSKGNPMQNGFYVGESYKEIFYVSGCSVQSKDGFSECYQHDFSTFVLIDNPIKYAEELKIDQDRRSLENARFIEKRVQEITDIEKRKSSIETVEDENRYRGIFGQGLKRLEYSTWPSSSDRNRMSNHFLGYP